jgi:Protein of unknown function (DUF3072)
MQKKKTAETQVQQELSSDIASTISRGAWTRMREPMTGAQATSLKRLAEEMREPHAFDAGLSKSEAARRIDRLQERLRLCELPPHTD